MTDQLTAAGLEIDDLATRIADLKTAVRNACGANLDLSPDQPDGQLVELFAEAVQAGMELLQEVYTAMDPDDATGDAQGALCALTGTNRRAATYGTVTLTLNLDAATTVPAGSIAHVSGDPTNRWITDTGVTSVGAGNYDVTATASETGPIQALAGTITVIATPVVGWNSVTNAADATEGLAEETDTELRLRREEEIAKGGSTNTDAITADVLDLDGALYAKTYENTTLITDGAGRPGKSIEVVVHRTDPPLTDAILAAQIYDSKAAGIEAYGSTVVGHVDDAGISHQIGFTDVTVLTLQVEATLTTDADEYPGDTDFKAYLADWADANLGVGDDVIINQLVAVCFEVDGVLDATLRIRFSGDPWGTINLTVADRELADLDTTGVTVL